MVDEPPYRQTDAAICSVTLLSWLNTWTEKEKYWFVHVNTKYTVSARCHGVSCSCNFHLLIYYHIFHPVLSKELTLTLTGSPYYSHTSRENDCKHIVKVKLAVNLSIIQLIDNMDLFCIQAVKQDVLYFLNCCWNLSAFQVHLCQEILSHIKGAHASRNGKMWLICSLKNA